MGDNCGKLCAVLHWYQEEYRHACEQGLCGALGGEEVVVIDNQYLDEKRPEGLFLHLEMIAVGEPVKVLSTAKVFRPSMAFSDRFAPEVWQQKPRPVGAALTADLFSFHRPAASDIEVTEPASHAAPVWSALKWSTSCIYRVPANMKAKKLPPSSRPARLAPARVRRRKIDSGSTGDCARL